MRRCHVPHCGKFYHEACIRLNPLTVFDNKGFRCPLHTCMGCYYGSRTKQKSAKGEANYTFLPLKFLNIQGYFWFDISSVHLFVVIVFIALHSPDLVCLSLLVL